MFKKSLALVALAALTTLPAMATTGTVSTNLLINATVVNACSVSVPAINMGAYDVFSPTGASGSSTASVTCTKGATPSISFASSVALTNLINADVLNVALSQTGSLGVSTSKSVAQTVTINASAGAGQDVIAASYSGSTTVSVNF